MSLRFLSCLVLSAVVLPAQNAAAVRKEIAATYARAFQAQINARTGDDLDAMTRMIDTPDCVSIVNDGPPQHWKDLRPGALRSLGRFGLVAIRIVDFKLTFGEAVVIARVGSPGNINSDNRSQYLLIRDTWIKTKSGWRRKMHERPAAGKLDAVLKK